MTALRRKTGRHLCVCLALWSLIPVAARAQHRREPLNSTEIDELRETALNADLRLKLYVKFARARLVALEEMRADPKTTDRVQQTRGLLQEFLDIYDELNDNLDNFADRNDDLRKPLKAVIEADVEFQAKLRTLKAGAGAGKNELEQYQFLLTNALETVDSSVQNHRQLLAEQEKAPKHKRP